MADETTDQTSTTPPSAKSAPTASVSDPTPTFITCEICSHPITVAIGYCRNCGYDPEAAAAAAAARAKASGSDAEIADAVRTAIQSVRDARIPA